MSEKELTTEEMQEAADIMERTLPVLQLVSGMFEPGDVAKIRAGCDEYEKKTQAHRVLADMFGRSAINQTDANVMAKIPTMRKLADLLESVYTLSERERLTVHGDSLWEKM